MNEFKKEVYLSVVFPVYNEEQTLPTLIYKTEKALMPLQQNFEIICVVDGSKDNSYNVLLDLTQTRPYLKIINFKVNGGQTMALSAGLEYASGKFIATADSDLENDPADIPRMLEKLHEGYDLVSGWRKNRWKGEAIKRKIPSVLANWLISKISGVHLHDYGCILKVYRSEIIKGFNLYGEMHRFIPAFAKKQGAKITEIEVNYQPRMHGKSNYGFSRSFRVILDLFFIKFMDKYFNRPMHFFGGFGFLFVTLGFVTLLVSITLRIFLDIALIQTPLPTLAGLFTVVGIQMVLMGIIAEILIRTYYESQNKKPYIIKDMVNFDK